MSMDGPDNTNSPPILNTIRIPTRNLKSIIAKHQRTFSPERFQKFMNMVRKVYNQYYSCFAEFHPGSDRAMMAHRIINKAIEQNPKDQPSCTSGCAACCHLEVEITLDEAELLAQLVRGGIEVDRQRLAAQASRERQGPEWKKIVDESNRCVFLGEDQACRIYDFRPLSCRKLLVSSPPIECSKGSDQIEPILLPLAEIALSAALSQPGNRFNSLPKFLQELLGAELEDGKSSSMPDAQVTPHATEMEPDLPSEPPLELPMDL